MKFRSILMNAASEADGGTASTEPAAAKSPPGETKGQKIQRSVGDLKTFIAAEKAKLAESKAAERAALTSDTSQTAAPVAASNAAVIADAPTETAEAAAKALAKAGEKVTEQRDGESDKKYEARLVKALQDLREMEGLSKREKAARETAEKNLATLQKKLDTAKDPKQVLKVLKDITGYSYTELTDAILEKKIPLPGMTSDMDDATRERIERIEAENQRLADIEEKRQKEENTRAQQAQYQQHITQAQTWLEANADEYPAISGQSWAANLLVQKAYQNGGDMTAPARELEEEFAGHILKALGNDRSAKSIKKRLPADMTAEQLLAKLGYDAPKAAAPKPAVKAEEKPEKSKPVARTATEATPPSGRVSRAELEKQASAGLRNHLRQLKEKRAG